MSTMDELRTKLADDDGSMPERWNPDDEPGTTLVGTLLRYETIVTKLGEGTLAVIEDADDGTVWGVLLGRTVLKKRFDTLAPKPGDMIGLKYVGFVEPRNKDSMGYHNYVLRVVRSASPAAEAAVATPTTEAQPPDDGDSLPF
jgi:hypothetical protein